MNQIIIDNIAVNIVRKKIKHMNLSVRSPHGHVRVAAPLKMSEASIHYFITTNLNWIKQKIKKYKKVDLLNPPQYESGEYHHYLGQCYCLNVISTTGESRIQLRDDGIINFYAHEQSSLISRQVVMTQWYRTQLKQEIIPLLAKWQRIIGVSITDFRIRYMKSRWGVCNIETRQIVLSSELIKKPLYCLEYIIVHELVHLLEASHNHRFKAYMDKYMPEWRQYKKELDERC
jgi:predicted metal-dependent hydrolase